MAEYAVALDAMPNEIRDVPINDLLHMMAVRKELNERAKKKHGR